MIKKIVLTFLVFVFFLFVPLGIYLMEDVTQGATNQEKIAYNLPYPGILPDHPLYLIKIIRDRIVEFTTRDNVKKAELYLLNSDKRTAMAAALAKKGKDKLAITTFSKAEKYFLKIPPLLEAAKKQGGRAPSEFIDRLKLSNAKHRELLETFLKDSPQGSSDAVSGILKINEEIKGALEKL